MSNSKNAAIVTLEEVLSFEPRLEKVLLSNGHAFEWSEDEHDFVAMPDFEGPEN